MRSCTRPLGSRRNTPGVFGEAITASPCESMAMSLAPRNASSVFAGWPRGAGAVP